MKKHFFTIFMTTSIALLLTGCEKQICSYCGEEKYCEEYEILDTTRYICKECSNDPEKTVSSNVVNEYQAPPLDDSYFGVGSDWHNRNNEETDTDVAVDDNSNSSFTNDSLNESSLNDTSTYDSSLDSSYTTEDIQSSSSSSGNTQNDIVGRLTSLLGNSGLQLAPVENDNNKYNVITSDGNNSGISITFDSSKANLAATVERTANGDINTFTNACIDASLAFINSTDVNQTGYEIFNSTCQYGNYSSSGCRFYYMDDTSASGDAPAATFDITY